MSTSSSDRRDFLNSFYLGINLENILYGRSHETYRGETLHILSSDRGTPKKFKFKLFYAVFSSIMLLSITVWVAAQAIFGQNMLLPDVDFPGGPYGYWKTNLSVWYMGWSTAQVIVLQLMTDALMIYRCRIIWNSYRIVVVPVMLWLASLALGALVAWANSFPGEDFHTGISSQFSLAYWTISVFLNTTLTSMICYRVVRHGKMIQEYLGQEYASLYFSIATIVIESVLPYTVSGVAFLVSLGVGSPTSGAFICVYFLMMCISPQMLILRVMVGSAWDNNTFNGQGGSTINFNLGDIPGSRSQWSESNLQTPSSASLPDGRNKERIPAV